MSDDRSNVVPLRVGEADLAAAWTAYDAAMLRLHAMYKDGTGERSERVRAALEADRLWKEFLTLSVRADVAAAGRG